MPASATSGRPPHSAGPSCNAPAFAQLERIARDRALYTHAMHWFWRATIGAAFGFIPAVFAAFLLPGLIGKRGSQGVWIMLSVMLAFHFVSAAVASALPTPTSAEDPETRCRHCGYILRGITEPRCPECGERI